MSWSFYAIGKPTAVLAKAQQSLSSQKCAEPEQTIKSQALDILSSALSAMPASSAVQIKASGSQYVTQEAKPAVAAIPAGVDMNDAPIPAVAAVPAVPLIANNSLSLEIMPIYDFVE